jgi:hypothetical protein
MPNAHVCVFDDTYYKFNERKLFMHIKLEDAPHCFWCRYIATVKTFFNFIGFDHIPFGGIVALTWHLNNCTIMSFINVLEQILDCTNLVANLNIDVRIDTLSTPKETQMQVPNWKQWKSKESRHVPWLVTLWKGRGVCWNSGMGLGRIDKLQLLTRTCTKLTQSGRESNCHFDFQLFFWP